MRILASVALATVLGVGAAYTIKGKHTAAPQTISVYRIAEIPKADSARIAALSAQSAETIRPPVASKRVAATAPAPPTVPSVAAKAKPKPKTGAPKKAKAPAPTAKPQTIASHRPNPK